MEKLNKIAIIEPVGGHGGMDYYDYGLAIGLASNNVSVEYHTCIETKERKIKDVNTFYTFKNVWKNSKFLKFLFYGLYHLKAFCQTKKRKIKIVHLHFFEFHIGNFVALLLAKLCSLKIVVTVHDIESFNRPSSKFIEGLCYRLTDGIIVHNKSSYRVLLSKGYKLPPLTIIPHGNYIPFIQKQTHQTHSKKLRLLFFGQIKEVKGLDILLEAMALVIKQNENVELTIAGRPWNTEKDKYISMIEKLGLRNCVKSHFRYIPDDEVSNFYENTDLVILPYRRIYQSGVLLLTMSYGKAVITSNLPAFEEIITPNVNGFTFESENPDSLAQCILELNYKKLISVTQNAYKTITEKYNWTNIGKQTLEFYQSL